MKKPLPIGQSDFETIRRKGHYFVDKSSFIASVIDEPSPVLLLPRPRRFGKSLNLSMLHTFLSRPDCRDLFDDLTISQTSHIEQQGQWPVLFLNFKHTEAQTFDDFLERVRSMLRTLCRPLEPHFEQEDLIHFARITDEESSKVSLAEAFGQLTFWLRHQHGRKVWVLIDEYDAPIHAGFQHGYYEEVTSFFRTALGLLLKDNPSLESAVMTGVLRVSRESLFSGLNNVLIRSVLDHDYATSFGFTEAEVVELLHNQGLEEHLPLVTEWYDGYRFGGETIYNPWSMLNYARDSARGPLLHWVNTSSTHLIRELISKAPPKSHAIFETLLKGETVWLNIDEHSVFQDLTKQPNALWSLLLFSGYLTSVDERDFGKTHALRLPNREITELFRTVINQWLGIRITELGLQELWTHLLAGEAEAFAKILGDIIATSLSYHDTATPDLERVFHAFMLGLLVNLSDYEIRSNRETGKGRADILLRPRRPEQPGLVIELKKADQDLEAALDVGIEQIKTRDYAAELRDAGVTNRIGMAVALKGKDVAARSVQL